MNGKKNIINSVLSLAFIFLISKVFVICGGLYKTSKNVVKGNWCKSQLPFCFWCKCKRAARRQAFFVKAFMELDIEPIPFRFND